jgi:TonB family protein
MEGTMKNAILLALAGAACVAAAAPVAAQSNLTTRYDHWEQRLRDRINDLLSYPEAAGRAAGDVFVGFRIGADGKPIDVAVRKSSGYAIFDNAAVGVVSRLGRLGPVPSANGAVGEVIVKLSYGDGSSTRESMRLAKSDGQERLANRRRDLEIVSAPTQVAQNR